MRYPSDPSQPMQPAQGPYADAQRAPTLQEQYGPGHGQHTYTGPVPRMNNGGPMQGSSAQGYPAQGNPMQESPMQGGAMPQGYGDPYGRPMAQPGAYTGPAQPQGYPQKGYQPGAYSPNEGYPGQAAGGMPPYQPTGPVPPAQFTGGMQPVPPHQSTGTMQPQAGYPYQPTGPMQPAQFTGGMRPVQPTGPMQPQAGYPQQPTGEMPAVSGHALTPAFRRSALRFFRDMGIMLAVLLAALVVIFIVVRLATRGYLWGLIFVLIAALVAEGHAMQLLFQFLGDMAKGKVEMGRVQLAGVAADSPSLLTRIGMNTQARYVLTDTQGGVYRFVGERGLLQSFGDLTGAEVELTYLTRSRLLTGLYPLRTEEARTVMDSARERHLRQVFRDYLPTA